MAEELGARRRAAAAAAARIRLTPSAAHADRRRPGEQPTAGARRFWNVNA